MSKTLTIFLAADVSKLNRGLKSGKASLSDFANGSASLGDVVKSNLGPALIGATAAAGALAVAFAVDGVKAAMEDEKAVAKLSQTLQNIGFPDRTKESLAFMDSLQMQYGVSEDLLRPAFERLVIATKDVALSQKDLQLAMDISAGTGKNLETVSNALGKAYEGNTGALGKLGTGIDKAILKTGDMDEITKQLSRTFEGQAAAAADTLSGKMNIVSIAVDEAKEKIGYSLVNALDNFFNKLGGPGGVTTQVDLFGTTIADLITGLSAFTDWLSRTPADEQKVADATSEVNAETTNWTLGLIQLIPIVGAYAAALVSLGAATNETLTYQKNIADAANQVSGPALQKAAEVTKKYGKSVVETNTNLNANTSATLKASAAQKKLDDAYQATVDIFNLAKGKLSDATNELKKWNDEIDAFITTTAGKITSGLNIGQAFEDATSEAGKTAGLTTAKAFQDQLAKALKFGNLLQKLKSSGAKDNLIQQVADVGPDAGVALAEDLIQSGLIPTLQSQFDEVQAQARTLAASLVPPFLTEGQSAARAAVGSALIEFNDAKEAMFIAGKAAGKTFGAGLLDEIRKAIEEAQAAMQNVKAGAGVSTIMGQDFTAYPGGSPLSAQEANFFDIAAYNANYAAAQLNTGNDIARVIQQSNNRIGYYEIPTIAPVLQ